MSNHYYMAAALAVGFSKEYENSKSNLNLLKVNTINIDKILKFLKENYSDKLNYNINNDETNLIIQDMLEKNNQIGSKHFNQYLTPKKCCQIFKSSRVQEQQNEKKMIQDIETNFLKLIKQKQSFRLTNLNSEEQIIVRKFFYLTYARSPVYYNEKITLKEQYDLVEDNYKHYYYYEIQLNKDYFMLSDLYPVLKIDGKSLEKNTFFNLRRLEIKKFNKAPLVIMPYSSTNALVFFKGIKEDKKIIDKILQNDNFIYYYFNIALLSGCKKIVYNTENINFILGNFLKTLIINNKKIVEKRKKVLKYVNELHK